MVVSGELEGGQTSSSHRSNRSPAPPAPALKPRADSDVVLVFGEVDLWLGVDQFAGMVDEAVLLIGTGGSTAEVLRTTSGLFSSARLAVSFAV